MKITSPIATFLKREDGAVTVDWVVLAASLVGLVLAIVTVLESNIDEITTEIQADLTAAASNDPGLTDN